MGGQGWGGKLTLIPSDEAIKTQIRVGDGIFCPIEEHFIEIWRLADVGAEDPGYFSQQRLIVKFERKTQQ